MNLTRRIGKHLRTQELSQGQINGFPAYFRGFQRMVSIKFMFRFCNKLVPVRVERLGPARFRLASFEALALPQSGDRQADTVAVMATLNEILEAWVRDRPEQWLWLHRRWPEAAYREAEGSGAGKPAD